MDIIVQSYTVNAMITPNPRELTALLESIEPPAIIQLIAKTTARCTPIDLYTVLKSESPKYSYLLESVEKEKHHARFSFVGSDPDAVITISGRNISLQYERSTPLIKQIEADLSDMHESGVIRPEYDVLDALKPIIPSVPYICTKNFDRQVFSGGAIGYHGYDVVYDCWLDIRPRYHTATPDAQFMLITHTVVFDHLTSEVYIILTPFLQDFSGDEVVKMYRNAESDAAAMISTIRRAEELNSGAQTSGGGHGQMTANTEQDEFEVQRRAEKRLLTVV
jgi:anthranilate synthase component 1